MIQQLRNQLRNSGLGSSECPTPYNQGAADALRALLTPKLGSMLKDNLPKGLLAILNSNLESPEGIELGRDATVPEVLRLNYDEEIGKWRNSRAEGVYNKYKSLKATRLSEGVNEVDEVVGNVDEVVGNEV